MKKLCILAVTLLASLSALHAQEAFKHLSLGLEAGTAGVGLEINVPIVTNHVVLKAGYNWLSIPYNTNTSISSADLNNKVSEVNSKIAEANQKLATYGEKLNTTFNTRFDSSTRLDIGARANVSNIKALFEIYPSKNSGFHITAGAFIGLSPNLADLEVSVADSFWTSVDSFDSELGSLRNEVNALKQKYSQEVEGVTDVNLPSVPSELKVSLGNDTYSVRRGGKLNMGLKVMQLRPYLGLGVGRSLPGGHLGFQFDLGAWYHGTPSIDSPNKVAYDSSAPKAKFDIDIIKKVPVYPVVSLRLIYKVF